MEVHVELKTHSKMFCSCPNNPDESKPNINICEICTAQPGTLPVPNKAAIAMTVKISQALGASIRPRSKFDRKHYFYPDLPKGYQISQYDEPIGEHGTLTLELPQGENPRDEAPIGIRRIHLEEDTSKLFHGTHGTLVDFNRAGTPLVEIVTDPDFISALEAKIYCQELRTLLRSLDVSDADMEKGHMRCEANISLQEAGTFEIINGEVRSLNGAKLNPKVELKNLNSFKAVEKGILFEIERQTRMIEAGESWVQQTRGWNEDEEITVLQRVKENAADYRYFPDPDIPPFEPMIIAGTLSLPELPQAKRKRFIEEYNLSRADATLLSEDKMWANFTEAVMSEVSELIEDDIEIRSKIARLVGGWITSKLMGGLAERNMKITDIKFTPENFGELISLIYAEKINSTNAQKILGIMLDHDRDIDPSHIMEEHGLGQVRDASTLSAIVDQVVNDYPTQVADFKAGKEPILKFLIGMAMKATEGNADPKMLEELLREKIKNV